MWILHFIKGVPSVSKTLIKALARYAVKCNSFIKTYIFLLMYDANSESIQNVGHVEILIII